MANPGVGSKFVSVNLNKSYGQQQHHNQYQHHGSAYGAPRARPISGGGGGMVVLSRPRSSHKTGQKLSVPPPLNLPSIRKEHEKFDSLGSNSGASGGAGSGSRPSSSGVGWTKPAAVSSPKETVDADHGLHGGAVDDGVSKRNDGMYMPPSVRSSMLGPVVSTYDKGTALRGEDFPSLRATLLTAAANEKKQKDGLKQKQKQVTNEDFSGVKKDSSSHVDMVPQFQQSSRNGSGLNGNGDPSNGIGSYHDQARKKEDYFLGPLPIVRLNPRSNWEDDERDTGSFLTDRSRDHGGFSKNEHYFDRDFDMPRASVLPRKPALNLTDRWGKHDNDAARYTSSEVTRDVQSPTREGPESKSWRGSSLMKDEFGQNYGDNRNGCSSMPFHLTRGTNNEKNYNSSHFRDNGQNDFRRRDKPSWNSSVDSHGSRVAVQANRYSGNDFQKNAVYNAYSPGIKGPSINDPILNFGREKHMYSKSEKLYSEESSGGFDGGDPFSVGLVGVVKQRKDLVKQIEYHDPVRESFEAELEQVQKMQEQERKRLIVEQERVMELARREEEERIRLAREEEQRRRRLEEEVREAAWRAEREQNEALQKAEEQRISREEEKNRIFYEEERRKQAAKQKLIELEEKIAKRQAEATTKGGSSSFVVPGITVSGSAKEREVTKVADVSDWEDGERMVERITSSASSDSLGMNRSFENGSSFLDQGKHVHTARREEFDNGNGSTFSLHDQDNGHHVPGQDALFGGRGFPRKELYGGTGFTNSRAYHGEGQRWNMAGYGDQYSKQTEVDSGYHENLNETFGNAGWGQGRSHGSPYPPYPERLHPNYEADGIYSAGRLRHSMRQPRVLPPPTLTPINRSQYRRENELSGPTHIPDSEMPYMQTVSAKSEIVNVQQEIIVKNTQRCDSQSSLSVTSPPDSPIQLSHDDLDESEDFGVFASTEEGKDFSFSGPGFVGSSSADAGKVNSMNASISISDDEEWAVDNDEQVQEREEYDVGNIGYQEEDEGVELGDENIDFIKQLKEINSEEKDTMVLGFNEGVDVGMPSDEFKRSAEKEETVFVIPHTSVSIIDKEGLSKGQALPSVDVQSQPSSRGFLETKIPMQNLTIQSSIVPTSIISSSSGMMDHVDISNISGLPTEQFLAMSSSAQTAVSSVPAASSQTEVPVKLQFGLFSGPSLIPSPVPAIQIGSIQMPLHLHPHVGSSLSQLHTSQSPLFQFGQLRYTPPISQGLFPLAPQSMSFVHANVPSSFSLNQNPGGSVPIQHAKNVTSSNVTNNSIVSSSMNNQPGLVSWPLDLSHGIGVLSEGKPTPVRENPESSVVTQKDRKELTRNFDNIRHDSERQEDDSSVKNVTTIPMKDFRGQPKQRVRITSQGYAQTSAGRGRKYFAVKNSGSRSTVIAPDASFGGIQRRPWRQRTEYRVRENVDRIQSTGVSSSSVVVSNRSSKETIDTESSRPGSNLNNSQRLNSGSRHEKGGGKDLSGKSQSLQQSTEGTVNRNTYSELDGDESLQSGLVHVLEQSGIETPSDEDCFIEVRSRRQVLNDRRQKEKEIKAAALVTKAPGKPRSTLQKTNASGTSSKVSRPVIGEGRSSNRSQTLAPIGTPALKFDSPSDIRSQKSKPVQTSSLPEAYSGGKNLLPVLTHDNKNKDLINVQTLTDSWGNSQFSQRVVANSRNKLDEPAEFEQRTSSVVDHTSSVGNSIMLSAKEKSFQSVSSPINSLLAGEKIQFGAVTSSTVLPPSSSAVSQGIGTSRNLSANKNDCSLFFDTNKHSNESPVHLEDSEAEAEAAASAVAVAVISSDENAGNGLETYAVSVSDTKIFGDTESARATIGGASGDQQLGSMSRTEESLSLALPADLSVETPPISLWPLLPGPQNTTSQMLSPFPGGPPSHFPFYEMNPMLGPFIAQSGAIPGVQGPPHMVVYNPFAPVEQFGQVGLSGYHLYPIWKAP